MVNINIDALFNKIGRMYMELVTLNERLLALQQQNSELSRVAGEALRALESFGQKDVAEKISKGEKWYETVNSPLSLVKEAPAEASESGSPEA